MSEQTIAINGNRVKRLELAVPFAGVWSVEADFTEPLEASSLTGAAVVQIGPTTLRGTFEDPTSGAYLLDSRCRILGGAGAWSDVVPRKAYHSDAGVRSRLVLDDLAREVGETWGTQFAPLASLGNDWVRRAGPAAAELRRVLGDTPWWVDYEGVTHAGVRAQVEASGAYEILEFDPRFKVALIVLDDPGAIGVGTVLRGRLGTPAIVRELRVLVTPESVRLRVWAPESTTWGASRLMRDLEAAVRGVLPELPYLGTYRYRVVLPNAGDHRWILQAVNSDMDLPDISPVSVHPGIAGAVATLPLGAVVLVSFVEGSPAQPYIHGFTPRDQEGWLPSALEFDASGTVTVGASADLVELGSGTEMPPPVNPVGRVLRYGDTIRLPPPINADYVLIPGTIPAGVAKVSA